MIKKILITSIVLILIIGAFIGWRLNATEANSKDVIQTYALKKSDLIDSVLVSGIVKSSKSKNVYSEIMNYSIKQVNVKVGDKVKAGDILAQIDTTALELDIREREISINNAEASLKSENLSNEHNLHRELNNFEAASIELKSAQKALEQTKLLNEAGANSNEELSKAESNYKKAQIDFSNAQAALEIAKSKNTSIQKNDVKLQKIALEKQKKTLKDSKITAPIDGTVTLVNAREGGASTGLLFVIEDTENLIVSTQIGEYDISAIKPGLEVIIKTDGTGDKQFLGAVSKIAPTAVKDANGNTAASSNVQFDTEIALKDKDPKIKIGMTVRLTIKLNVKKDVYYVPSEAIVKGTDGSQWVNILENVQNGSKPQNNERKIQVRTGMETDINVEISSPELKDGMTVVVSLKDGTQEQK